MTTGDTAAATGYERLLYDSTVGGTTLFRRAHLVEAAWTMVTPIPDVWRSLPPRDVPDCPAASRGPAAAEQFLARDGRGWWWP